MKTNEHGNRNVTLHVWFISGIILGLFHPLNQHSVDGWMVGWMNVVVAAVVIIAILIINVFLQQIKVPFNCTIKNV